MKPIRLFLAGLLLLWAPAKAQDISITYNYEAAEKLIQILESNAFHEQDFAELMELHGTQAYLKKLGAFFPEITAATFKQSLKAVVEGSPLEEDSFMFNRILPHISEVKELLNEISAKETQLTQSSVSLLEQYSPKNIELNVNVYMVLGIVGGGWTFDDEPDAFYVDLTFMQGDYLGVTYLSTHELYHLLQYRFMQESPQKGTDKVAYLLDQMLREGSATYVADFSKVEEEGFYIDFSKEEYSRNFRRMETNFALFETLLTQAHQENTVDIDLLYNIGLSGMYQSPLYYVGYHMMKLIAEYQGREALIDLLGQSPEQLILAYQKLCDAYGGENDEFIPLTQGTQDMISSLQR